MNLLTSSRLNCYLTNINEQAKDMFLRLTNQIVEREGVTEQLKTDNQMKWVAQMNHPKQSSRNHESRYNLQLT